MTAPRSTATLTEVEKDNTSTITATSALGAIASIPLTPHSNVTPYRRGEGVSIAAAVRGSILTGPPASRARRPSNWGREDDRVNRTSIVIAAACTSLLAGCFTPQALQPAGVESQQDLSGRTAATATVRRATSRPLSFYFNGFSADYSETIDDLITVALPSLTVTAISENSSDGVSPLGPLAVGSSTLYALNNASGGATSAGTIYEYTLGDKVPRYNFDNGYAESLAADAKDNVYVLEIGPSQPSIAVYPPNASVPTRTITQGLTTPQLLTIAPNGDLYVGNADSVVAFKPGASRPYRTITNGIAGPNGLAWDKRGRLIVANTASVTIYPPKTTAPAVTITQGIADATCVAVGPTLTVYVGDKDSDQITEYDNEQPVLSRTIQGKHSDHPHHPALLSVDSSDTLYVLTHAVQPNVQKFLSRKTKPSGGTGSLVKFGMFWGNSTLGTAW
jgi:hypothetical protein